MIERRVLDALEKLANAGLLGVRRIREVDPIPS